MLPDDDRCPECLASIDYSSIDPPFHELQSVLGTIVCRIGEVKFRRKLLPDRGMLYATTKGLFFAPHRVDYVTKMVAHEPTGSSIVWSLAAIVWSPLMFVLPFFKNNQLRPVKLPVERPQFLSRAHSTDLPKLLMGNPGTFFVSRRQIRVVERKWNGWHIDRLHGTPLRFRPERNGGRFLDRMTELTASEVWRELIVK